MTAGLTCSKAILRAGVSALVLLSAVRGAGAQVPATESLPPCDSATPATFPCRTPFDEPPSVLEQPALPGTGTRRAPWVWVFVTQHGTVEAAQIQRGAGLDFDIAAVARAKQLRFTPARLDGSPVAAWFLLAIETTAAPEPCPTMAVPLSAGVAIFADSESLARPELGMVYRYQGMGGLPLDVFIYPRADWPPPSTQVRSFVAALDSLRARDDLSSYSVQKQGAVQVNVTGPRPRRTIALHGHAARVTLVAPSGEERTTYFSVFPEGDKYIKFRATYSTDRRLESTIDEFIRQVLSARASTPPHCAR
jgi:hypothetical protein